MLSCRPFYTQINVSFWFTYQKGGEDGDTANEVGDSLEEKSLEQLSVFTTLGDEQREEDKGEVKTGGENVDDEKIYQKPAQ